MPRNDIPPDGDDVISVVSTQPDHRADTMATEPGTELATVPMPSAAESKDQRAHDRALAILRTYGRAAAAELRFAHQRPPSLRDQLAYARAGEWTEDIRGARRHVMHGYVLFVAIPLTTVAYLIAWAAARPGRLISTTAITTLILTALNTVPGVRLLVPDWTTWPYWPPLSWIL
ncbi:MAG: hypothetical protein AB7I38_11740 [Dehalococcoidia bacterium]